MKNLLRVFAAFVLLAVASSNTNALVLHNSSTTPESDYLEHAQLFPSVGWLFSYDGDEPESFSSGVLIDEHWVLTSAHGVLTEDNNASSIATQAYFGLGSDIVSDPGERQFTTQIFVHPDYSHFEVGPDLALIYFENAFESSSPTSLYTGAVNDLLGIDTHLVGYGISGTPATGYDDTLGIKRAGIVTIHSVASTNSTFMEARFWELGDSDGRPLGVLGAGGDSGGGWFIEDAGEFYLTGISSFATLSPRYGNSTYATILQPELDWIAATIAANTVPEPTSLLLLLTAAVWCSSSRFARRAK